VKTFASVVLVLLAVLVDVSAQSQRDWQQGTWRDTDQSVTTIATGSKAFSLPFQTCVIETTEYFYFGRKPVNLRGTKAVPLHIHS